LADVVANNQAGLVVPYDSNSLHDALYHILNDEECQQRFGENGKSLVRNQFNWEKIAKQVEDIYAGSIISA
jgi:glycosyltransferase involved in cell wall biosynthesis